MEDTRPPVQERSSEADRVNVYRLYAHSRTFWIGMNCHHLTTTCHSTCSIPTLIALSPDGGHIARLGPELEACQSEDQAQELLKTFAL